MKIADIDKKILQIDKKINENGSSKRLLKERTKLSIIRHFHTVEFWVLLVVLLGCLFLTIIHTSSHRLFIKSCKEFADSCVYYFKSLISWNDVGKEGVSFLIFDDSITMSILPINIDVFGYRFLSTWQIMFNGDFAKKWWGDFAITMANLLNIFLILALPGVIGIYAYYNFGVFKENDLEPSHQSKPLILYLKFKETVLKRIKRFFINLWNELRFTPLFFWSFLMLALYNINLFSFFLIFFAWYMYFIFSIDFVSVWYLICKFLICISPLLHPFFWPFWILFFIFLIIKLKLAIGFGKLEDMYNKNDDFCSNLGIFQIIVGQPGSGKTKMVGAIALQQEARFRKKAADDMFQIRSWFPDFPFRYVEDEVEKLKSGEILYREHRAVNKIQIEDYFQKKLKTERKKKHLYSYDLESQKTTHLDGLKEIKIIDALIIYAQLYYIYISTLGVSTYGFRYDKAIELNGTFPTLQYNFFHTKFADDEDSEYAKIFDLNMLRMYSQYNYEEVESNLKNRKTRTLWDFGVGTFSEFGKERGNRFTNLSRNIDVNPTKDGTPNFISVLRHVSTVNNYPYTCILCDEQKLGSFSGLEVAMAEYVVSIANSKETTKNALPLWLFEGIILDWGAEKFNKLQRKYVYTRNDQTLFSYIVGHCAAFFNGIQAKINNTFGYSRKDLSLSRQNVNGAQEKHGDTTFFLMNKVIYANRYKTDCYKGFFDALKKESKEGINELDSFNSTNASFDELLKTNGYFDSELGRSMATLILENRKIEEKKDKGDDKKIDNK